MISRAIIQTDGASRRNPGPASIGGVIWDEDGGVLAEISEAIGIATNNVAEYKALVETLAKALELDVRFVDVRLDSELIVRQVSGRYRTKKPELQKLLSQVQGPPAVIRRIYHQARAPGAESPRRRPRQPGFGRTLSLTCPQP